MQPSFDILSPYKNKRGVLLLSGGRDSVCLLHWLKEVMPELSISCLHVNYHLRGLESDRDEHFVRSLCKKLGVSLHVEHADINCVSGLQNRARDIRYDLAYQLAKVHSWSYALTAHHADDQMETLLFRMARGCGLRGLQGIHLVRSGELPILRPLLTVYGDEISKYITDNSIEFVEDSSNLKNNYSRNKIRHQLLPEFKKNEGHFLDSIIQQSLSIQSYVETSLQIANQVFKNSEGPFYHQIKKSTWFELDAATQHILLEKLLHYYGYKEEVGQRLVASVNLQLISNKATQSKWGSSYIKSTHDTLVFGRFNQVIDPIEVLAPGIYKWGGSQVSIREISLESIDYKDTSQKYINGDKITWPMKMRQIRRGDRIRAYNRSGSKKVFDFLWDRKVPEFERQFVPLLESNGNLVSIVGVEIADDFKVLETSKSVLSVQII